jgi:hypothetical protein
VQPSAAIAERVAGPGALVLQAIDGRSLLWQWVNNAGNVIALLTVGVWLVTWLTNRAAQRRAGRTAGL